MRWEIASVLLVESGGVRRGWLCGRCRGLRGGGLCLRDGVVGAFAPGKAQTGRAAGAAIVAERGGAGGLVGHDGHEGGEELSFGRCGGGDCAIFAIGGGLNLDGLAGREADTFEQHEGCILDAEHRLKLAALAGVEQREGDDGGLGVLLGGVVKDGEAQGFAACGGGGKLDGIAGLHGAEAVALCDGGADELALSVQGETGVEDFQVLVERPLDEAQIVGGLEALDLKGIGDLEALGRGFAAGLDHIEGCAGCGARRSPGRFIAGELGGGLEDALLAQPGNLRGRERVRLGRQRFQLKRSGGSAVL
ncbi:hypothetical protein ACP_2450 [Acidobacterium capsulatum ATCC 51196]|uniref:Uncharacterized protein n=1 Tax=Acidobacterium capsulatum (strain ATCC 51196 / DSM 11244 / BCRC 80197 / JCM 7670 / NBRC 15755 / NCIMB 13165 / 161) TaxID=240015 RepID=C1F1E5_ACIC5|nr:hypothetical protein ACP_2450 [Acidobacterium capsulatum ATCC 51196]